MPEPNNSNSNSNDGGQGGAGGSGGDGGQGGTSTQGNQGGSQNPNPSAVDLKTLPADQLQQVLENPALWETPRMKELLQGNKELKELREKQQKADEDKLKEDKKFEELAQKKDEENSSLKSQIQTMQANQALTSILVKENVVDLDGALKLVDRSKITVKDDGTIEGTEEAIKALKSDKAYLFSKSTGTGGVGTPSNAGNQGQSSGTPKFKRSQLIGPEGTKFYQENKAAVDEAYSKGLVEDDISNRV